jgi:hypothetical protein
MLCILLVVMRAMDRRESNHEGRATCTRILSFWVD